MNPNYKISIPKPCHENWNAMSPDDKGRFCAACSKSVVDFTALNKEQVNDFMDKNKDKKICGRFTNDQLESNATFTFHVPQEVLYQKRSFHKAFLLALFVVMGTTLFSCKNHNNQTLGEIAVMGDTITTQIDSLQTEDSVVNEVVNNPSNPHRKPTTRKPKMDEVKLLKQKLPKEVNHIQEVTVGILIAEPPVPQEEPSAPNQTKGE